MFAIKNKNNQYLTRKGMNSDLNFTDNYNFAYVWKDEEEVYKMKSLAERLTEQDLTVVELVQRV